MVYIANLQETHLFDEDQTWYGPKDDRCSRVTLGCFLLAHRRL